MPQKPVKRGFKIWMLADSDTGYIIKFSIYEGKTNNQVEKGLGANDVLGLTENFHRCYHHLYFDNFFIGIDMGLVQIPELESYIPFFHDVPPCNRFEEIFWMLHLPLPDTPMARRVDRIKPLLNHLLVLFQSAYYPACEVSVDKTMVRFKGRVGFLQYCPLKPTNLGFKAFVLADSRTGYVLNVIPYIGSESTSAYLSNCSPGLPMPAKIVMAICEKYLDKGHHIFADLFYSSVPLVEELKKRGSGFTGTFVRDRLYLPGEVRAKKFQLRKGEQKAWRDGEKLVLAWRDKGKPTIMISTVFSAASTTYDGSRNIRIKKPLVVHQYNQNMGGVDIADQYGVYIWKEMCQVVAEVHVLVVGGRNGELIFSTG